MSEPRRFTFQSAAALPAAAELLRHLDRQHHVVLQFPAHAVESRKRSLIIEELKQQLPEYCSVFDSGGGREFSCITIMQVVSRPELHGLEEELVHAARHFRNTARSLAHRLAEHNRVLAMDLADHFPDLEPFSEEWRVDPHGAHICFVNRQTGQTVEVNVWYGDEFGILDPYFFHRYLDTTPGLRSPPEFINSFQDTARALDYLEERGRLTRLCSFPRPGTGLFAHDS